MRTVVALVTALIAGFIVLSASAGPVFDDLLNYPVIDQQCPANPTNEGLALAGHGKATAFRLTREQPIGQTITLGPKAAKLWRVCAAPCWYPDNWGQGEAITFTLYDSPAKTRKLYSRTIDFDHKWHKWDVAFDCRIPVRPNQTLYFELSHNGGGDNGVNVVTVPNDQYKRGVAYIAGKPQKDLDLYFRVITKPKGDRAANLRKFLARIDLNAPQYAAAKKAANAGKLDAACTLVLRAFEARKRDVPLAAKPVAKDRFSTLKQDQVCDEGRLYRHPEKRDEWIPMTAETNWRETWPNSASYIRQNDLFRELGEAYEATGNEKYARKLNETMLDYMQDNASPYEDGMRGGRWVAMFVGWRLGDAWDGFGRAMRSRGLTDDVKLGWIDYQARMAHFVELEPSGANQENASAECLMNFAYRFPDFRDSKKWQQQGFDRLMANSLDLYRPDGGSKEPTMNYQGYALGFLISGLDAAKKHSLRVPAQVMPRLEKIHEYIAYILAPDGQAPSNGDTNCVDFRANAKPFDGWRPGSVTRGADWFHREDLRFIATSGKQGTMPSFTSHLFPDTRYAVMRSDWGGPGGKDFDQARYLLFRAGYDGGHSHFDYNQVTLYAYGRHLIIDPGRTAYGTPLMSELKEARSHNVLLVDGLAMSNPTPTLNSWHTTPVMDLIDNTYDALYPGVDHRRAVVFVGPGYYVVFDEAKSDTPRKMGINFWLTPPALTVDDDKLCVRTNDPDGANVLIQSLDHTGSDAKITQRHGRLDLDSRIWDNIPVVTFWRDPAPATKFVTLLYPYPKGATNSVAASGRSGCCEITTPSGADVVLYRPTAPSPKATLEGLAGVIRCDTSGEVTAFALLEGTRIGNSKGPLASAASPINELSVRYTADAVEVTCPKPEASLEVAALGRTKAVVNGRETSVTGGMFRPF